VEDGALLDPGQAYSVHLARHGALVFDAAALGPGTVLGGDGELAVLRFRATGAPRPDNAASAPSLPRLRAWALRDAENRPTEASALPSASARRPQGPARPSVALGGDGEAGRLSTAGGPEATGGRLELTSHPNPFGSATEVRLRLAEPASVALRIHDVGGRIVCTLQSGPLPAGEHAWTWDGRIEGGGRAGAGAYFCVARVGSEVRSMKIYRVR